MTGTPPIRGDGGGGANLGTRVSVNGSAETLFSLIGDASASNARGIFIPTVILSKVSAPPTNIPTRFTLPLLLGMIDARDKQNKTVYDQAVRQN